MRGAPPAATPAAPTAATPLPGPATLHLDITNGCNADCVTCWDHSPFREKRRDSGWRSRRADVGATLALVDDARALGGLEAVIVSGMGEPFTHPGCLELVAGLKARGLHVTVITNLVAADPDAVAASGPDALLVGVHAATEATYRAFHPSFGRREWERLGTALDRLAASATRVKIVNVICAVNAGELPAMVDFADRFDVERVQFKLASLGGGTERVRIGEAERGMLLGARIPAAEERAAALGLPHNLPTFRAQVRAGGGVTAPVAAVGCHMGRRYARVAVDGSAYFCCNTETRIGRVGDGVRFPDLWRGAAWEAMRARLDRRDFLPGCARCGKFEQNAKHAARLAARRAG